MVSRFFLSCGCSSPVARFSVPFCTFSNSGSEASVASGVAGYDPATNAASTDTTATWKSTHAALSIGKADGSVTRQITGVAAGSEDTDAVNVAQLKALDEKKLDKAEFTEYKKETAATLSLMQKATDNLADTKANVALDNISEDGKTVVRDLAKESVKVIAGTNTTVTEGTDGNAKTYAVDVVTDGAAALAALHPLDTDSKFTMGAGFGNYRSENAMALGMFYRPNDQVMFSMGNGENLLNVGVSFALDKGVTTSKAAMAKKIAEQEEKIQTLEARLAALEAKLAK